MLQGMTSDNTGSVSVIDFRRQSMVLQWHVLGGTWTAYDVPPSLVHGIALIRAAQPNICVYGHGGRLRLQVGPNQYALSENSPRISCSRGVASFGLRRRFTVESSDRRRAVQPRLLDRPRRRFLPLARGPGAGPGLARIRSDGNGRRASPRAVLRTS